VGVKIEKLDFIDLFCGIGGFRYALENLGHNCVFSSDWDKDAQATYSRNFGDFPHGDLTKIKSHDIPPHHILCGGFPCQPFSISGKQHGFADARGTLLDEILRIGKFHTPQVLFLENVKNYLSHANGATLTTTLECLRNAGFDVFYKVLNASNFGVPQKRERLYFVCFRKDLGIYDFSFPEPCNSDVALEDILLSPKSSTLEGLYINRDDLRLSATIDHSRENRSIRTGTVGKGGQGERIYSSKGHAITLSAFGGGVGAKTGMYLIDGKVRRLHPRECARLMGFPEEFKIHERRNVSYKQFGNSVAIPVVKRIFQEIQKSLFNAYRKAA